jgi:diacylglycerol kinase family enzyme
MRIRLIVNEFASSVTPTRRIVVEKALGADHKLDVVTTEGRDHATELAREAAADEVDLVVVLAGDGTLNEAANGLLGTDTALSPLPGGSTSVFARILGYSTDTIEALGQLLQAIDLGQIRPIDVGTVNGRAFLFHAGFGFDAAVIERIEQRSSLKRYLGHPAFLGAAVDTWFRQYDRTKMRGRLEIAGEIIDDLGLVIALNSDPYTFLGTRPVSLEPRATLDNPLAVLGLRKLRLSQILRTGAGALTRPLLAGGQRDVVRRYPVHEAHLTSDIPMPYQVDGDYLGDATSFSITNLVDALRVVRP